MYGCILNNDIFTVPFLWHWLTASRNVRCIVEGCLCGGGERTLKSDKQATNTG